MQSNTSQYEMRRITWDITGTGLIDIAQVHWRDLLLLMSKKEATGIQAKSQKVRRLATLPRRKTKHSDYKLLLQDYCNEIIVNLL